MAKDTKSRLLEAALEIFARDGYEGTNIKEIAEAAGLVKSGLYRHYDSKRAIWEAAIGMTSDYYEEHMGARNSSLKAPKTKEELYEMTMSMVDFTLHDNKVINTRKILTKEQFRDERVTELANRHFLYDMESMFAKIFSKMMEEGTIKMCDPDILALSYTTPITALIHLCDRDPGKEEEALTKLDAFVRMFIDEYGL